METHRQAELEEKINEELEEITALEASPSTHPLHKMAIKAAELRLGELEDEYEQIVQDQ